MSTSDELTVLIIEDNPANVGLLLDLFNTNNINVAVAKNGDDALRIASRIPLALAVIDINLPDIDGFDLAKQLQALYPTVEQIFCSAETGRTFRDRAFQNGAIDYIEKPFEYASTKQRLSLHLDRLQLRLNLVREKALLERMISSWPSAVISFDDESKIIMWNPAAEKLFGIDYDSARRLSLHDAIPIEPSVDDQRASLENNSSALNAWEQIARSRRVIEARNRKGDRRSIQATVVPWEEGGKAFGTLLIQDVTVEEQLRRRIRVDVLTGALSRAAFDEDLADGSRRADCRLCIIDIDYFKSVNDNYGHAIGDMLLQEFVKFLQRKTRRSSRLYRLGGEEFALVDPGDEDLQALKEFAQEVHACASEVRLQISGRTITRTVTIGAVSLSRKDSMSDRMREADALLNLGKNSGRNQWRVQDEHSLAKATRFTQKEILKFLDSDEVCYYYQPIVDVGKKVFLGTEALIRLVTKDKVFSPDTFIDELYAATSMLNGTTIRCDLLKQNLVKSDSHGSGFVTFNIRLSDIAMGKFEQIIGSLGEVARTRQLIVEVSERAVEERSDLGEALLALQELKNAGFQIALDDFGTQGSNFDRLIQWPIDVLKLDKIFADRICSDKRTALVVRTLVFLAKEAGIKLIAEGIESTEQARRFEDLGITAQQGFLYARPRALDSETFNLSATGLFERFGV